MGLVRDILTVMTGTLGSRVLGFVRDTMIAAALGTAPVADAFFVAFRLPNTFRRLFAEGAFAAAFVPLLVRLRETTDDDEAKRFAAAAAIALIGVVGLVSLAAAVAAPGLVGLLAPGFAGDPAKFDLTVRLTRICLPYLAAITAAALFAGLLAADRRFLAAAFAPVLLNLVFIAVLVGLAIGELPGGETAGALLSAAVVVAGVAQAAWLIRAAAVAGLMPDFRRPRFDARLARFARLLGPGLVAGGLVEIQLLIGTTIVSGTAGAVSWLYYADRLYQLPLGVIGVAVGQVVLPEIAVGLGARDPDEPRRILSRAIEAALALSLPAAVALALLARPITVVLFERGAFAAADSRETAAAIAVFAVGLPGQVLVRVFSAAFFAREDTRTPMLAGLAAAAIGLAAAVVALPRVGWTVVPAGIGIAGWLDALILAGLLLRRRHWRFDRLFLTRLPRLVLAAALTGVAVALVSAGFDDPFGPDRRSVSAIAALALLVIVGVAVQLGAVVGLGIVDRRIFRRRRADPPCPTPTDAA
jgi:putative peptidoglycan lipid II flippase